jgi:hypothetical protein
MGVTMTAGDWAVFLVGVVVGVAIGMALILGRALRDRRKPARLQAHDDSQLQWMRGLPQYRDPSNVVVVTEPAVIITEPANRQETAEGIARLKDLGAL